jgi:hypothetical protein
MSKLDSLNLKKFKIETMTPDSTVLLNGRRRCLAKGTEVLMYDGTIKKIEDIKVGDLVMGDDSTQRTVLSTHNGKDTMYRVTCCGEEYVVNSGHILSFISKITNFKSDIPLDQFLSMTDEVKSSLLGYKIAFQSGKIEKGPVIITQRSQGEYYGIELSGNKRYILANGIVTHNSGKSFLVRDIFYHHRHIPKGVIFSGTEEASPFFGDFVPDIFIHNEYDPEMIEGILRSQKKKIREAKDMGKSESGKCKENNFFIVLDDLLHDAQNWKREKTIKNIFFNGRHFNLFFILTMQYPLGITPELRSNIDYVFVFNEPSFKNRRKLYDDYFSIIPSFDYFCNILDACTKDHECLVVKLNGTSNKLEDQIFWYKAEAHKNFRVGHKKYWKFHKENYNKHYESDNEERDNQIEKFKQKFSSATKKLKVFVNREGNIVGHERDTDSS